MSESRKQFEEWAKQFRYDLTISDPAYVNRPYVNDFTDWSWLAWSARDSEVERLREALKPFAEFGEPAIWRGTMWEGREEDSQVMHSHATGKSVTLGDFLRALRGLSPQVKESGK